MNAPDHTLAGRLKFSREAAKLSQAELGRRVGVTSQAINQIESGVARRTSYILALAEILGVDANWLNGVKPAPALAPRKIIQITNSVSESADELITTALRNDGSVWEFGNSGEWNALPPIPQDEEPTP